MITVLNNWWLREVARDAKHLFDIVFKQVGKRKNSGQSHVRTNSGLEIPGHHSRQNSANLERVREDSNDSSESQSSGQSSAIQRAPPIHVRRSTFFKYASKDWLRSQLKQVPAIPLNLYVNTQQATDRQHGTDLLKIRLILTLKILTEHMSYPKMRETSSAIDPVQNLKIVTSKWHKPRISSTPQERTTNVFSSDQRPSFHLKSMISARWCTLARWTKKFHP